MTADTEGYWVNVWERSILGLLSSVRLLLSPEDAKRVEQYVFFQEFGLAFDDVCAALVARKEGVSPSTLLRLSRIACRRMRAGLDEDFLEHWRRLAERIDTAPFAFQVVAGRTAISLAELGVTEAERKVELQVGAEPPVTINFPPALLPSLTLGSSQVAVWAGATIFFHAHQGSGLVSQQVDDELIAVYELGRLWLLVTETSVLLCDPVTLEPFIRARLDHEWVAISAHLAGDELRLTDSFGRALRIEVAERPPTIRLVESPPSKSPAA